MRRAIAQHRFDFAAVAILLVLAAGTAAYILARQPAFTLGRSYYVVKAQFASAAAVNPGQGEAVTIAGVPVGTIGAVKLAGGRAVVTLDIDRRYAPIYRNATVLLRERTPLKDMYLSLYPGTRGAGAIPDGGTLGAGQTQPDVDVDQILGSLDADTRTYLLLALSGGAAALSDKDKAPNALRAIFKRFPPLLENTAAFTKLLAKRNQDLRGAIHNLNRVAGALGGVDTELSALVSSSDTDFSAVASQDQALQSALTKAPATLNTTAAALGSVKRFAATAAPALTKLVPFTKQLAPALAALAPLAKATNTPIKTELTPFTTKIEPLARALAPAAASLAAAVPDLTKAGTVVNELLNALAHKPAGTNSYLYWGAWLAHNADSVVSMQDANGAVARTLFMAACPALGLLQNVLQQSQPSIGALLDLLNAPDAATLKSSYCPATATPGA